MLAKDIQNIQVHEPRAAVHAVKVDHVKKEGRATRPHLFRLSKGGL
jgi:hypothetical protein